MSSRDKIIRYYRASGEAELAGRLIDMAEGASRSGRYRISEFLDPHGCTVAETVIAHYPGLRLETEGGYGGAERVKTAFVEYDFGGSVDFGLTAAKIKWDERHYSLSHRDVLGSLMGLGIKRELFGDIIMQENGCFVVADAAMATYIIQNLTTIGAATVSISSAELSDIPAREEKIKEIRATVASLRLDSVAAAGFGLSRSKMASEIEAAKLKVNWQPAKGVTQIVAAGDTISMRGRGRLEVCEITGQTRKGRISILLRRYY